MVVVCDINEVWRKKPFSALAEKTDVLAVSPADWLVTWRREKPLLTEDSMEVLPVVLPPSWASRMAWLGQRMLWKKVQHRCKALGQTVDALFVTSPHYVPMLSMIPSNLKTFYYASDDYHSYEGWGAAVALEKQMVQRVDHSFFVSQGLMDRALEEYGVDAARLSVSMNATEPRFFSDSGTFPAPVPTGKLKRPIAGVVGGIGARLDFNLLKQCADLPELGTLLLVGPVPAEPSTELKQLLDHPKCVAVGRQPHNTIHRWFQCLDIGLIPYAKTEFNRLCSPMRLFDHLASGAPLVATDACDQGKAFEGRISICSDSVMFAAAVQARLGESAGCIEGISWNDRAVEILNVMEGQRIA